jgi:hypothetical protein
MAARYMRNTLNSYSIRLWFRIACQLLLAGCLGLALCLLLFPLHSTRSDAHAATTSTYHINMQVDLGFDGVYRPGYWMPVHVSLTNGGAAFHGSLALRVELGTPTSDVTQVTPWSFGEPVTLAKGAHQQVTLYVPVFPPDNANFQGILATLRDEHGKTVVQQTAIADPGNVVSPGYLYVGTLADSSTDFSAINGMFLPGQAGFLTLTSLRPATVPSLEAALENFDIIVLDDFNTAALRPNQLLALQTWVNRGGILIEIGGPSWKRTLGSLPENMLPVTLQGTRTLAAGTRLLSPKDPLAQDSNLQQLTQPLPGAVTVSAAAVHAQPAFSQLETVLSVGGIPLFVQAHQGQGVICYLGFDLASPAFSQWYSTSALWRMALTYALGDTLLVASAEQSYSTGPGQLLTHGGVLDMLVPATLPGPYVLIACLCGYALILGPLRLFIVKRLKHAKWWWPLLLLMGIIVIYTPLAYELATYERSASIIDTSVSLVQMNQDGSSAHITTYSGIYVPTAGNFTLNMPGASLTEPISQQYMPGSRKPHSKKPSDMPESVNMEANSTQLTMPKLSAWSLHDLVSEQDVRLPGAINTHLALRDGQLVGTISNTLDSSLSDLYVLLPHQIAALGHLGAGETRQIDVPMTTVQSPSEYTLADDIAAQGGLPTSYFPYTQQQSPSTEFQRHMALLSALEGAGFSVSACHGSCKTYAITDRDTIYVTGGRVPNPSMNTAEPLLVPGAPATLIGWADQPLTSGVTVNGWHPVGQQDSMIQMPLSLDFNSSAAIPSDVIMGHVIDVQSYDAELRLSGIYAMIDGSITFEFLAPDIPSTRGLTISLPDLWAHPFGPGSGFLPSHIQAQVYNWHTGTWNNVTLHQDDTLDMLDPRLYVGPSGRVLLQVTNQDDSLGSLYFGPPSLSVK